MVKTLFGVFVEKDNVALAISTLRERGFDAEDISIVMKDSDENSADVTSSGAPADALGGRLVAALQKLGLSDVESEEYEAHINEGGILVAVPISDTNEATARRILEDFDAMDVRSYVQTTETIQQPTRKRTYADMEQPEKYEGYSHPDQRMFASAGSKGGKTTRRKTRKRKQ